MNNQPFSRYLVFTLLVFFTMAHAQEKDIWTGQYSAKPLKNDLAVLENTDTLIIEKTTDANRDAVAGKYESDLLRWTLFSKKEGNHDKIEVRRFLYDLENDENEYDEFGWTDLHANGKMECLDGGHFFICQTQPNTLVKFSKEESFVTKTGIFGIWLHFGLVELEKVK